MSSQQTTRGRNDIVKTDAIPSGNYELNYRQAAVLNPLGMSIAGAVLFCGIVGIVVEPASGILFSASSVCFCLMGIGSAILAAEIVAGDAIWWMSADYHVPAETLWNAHAAWGGR